MSVVVKLHLWWTESQNQKRERKRKEEKKNHTEHNECIISESMPIFKKKTILNLSLGIKLH